METTLEGAAGDAAAIIEVAREAAGPAPYEVKPGRVYLVRTRNGRGEEVVTTIDTEFLDEQPRRAKGTARFDHPESFVAYVNEFKAEGRTRVYADLASGVIQAVINDDDVGDYPLGAFRDHRATLVLRRTPEWERWRKQDGLMVSQVEFAEFLEINLRDIQSPAAADLIEIARTFTASNDIQFHSAVNLSTGETRFAYDETVDAKAGPKKDVAVPREFQLSLAPYRGGDVQPIGARLRYRLKNGGLTLGFLLDRPEEFEEVAFGTTLDVIQAETDLTALWGMPATERG